MTLSPDTRDDSTLRPQPVGHDAFHGCSQRIEAPCGASWGPYRLAERLHNGDTACHGCQRTFRPHELPQAANCHRRTAA